MCSSCVPESQLIVAPQVYDHLEDIGVDLPAITFGWYLSLFCDALPIQTLLRVWDVLLVYGPIVLFKCVRASAAGNYVMLMHASTGLPFPSSKSTRLKSRLRIQPALSMFYLLDLIRTYMLPISYSRCGLSLQVYRYRAECVNTRIDCF